MQKIKSLNDLIKTFKGDKKLALVINGKEISYDNLWNLKHSLFLFRHNRISIHA